MQWRRGFFGCFLLGATALAFAGCHHEGGGSVPGGTPTSSSFPGLTTSTSVTLNSGGGSVPLSSTGLASTLQYPSNNGGGGGGTYTLTTVAPALPAAPNGNPIVFGELVLTSSVNFSSYFWVSSVTIPTSLLTLTSSNQVFETVYDQTASTQLGNAVTGTISGQTVTFNSIGSSSFTANANDTYLFVISYQ
jgi:hypothetical protein